jgi:hypothetical protein
VSIPLSGAKAFHCLVDDGDIPPPGVVVLKLKEMRKITYNKILDN